jgi:hypothetical protein
LTREPRTTQKDAAWQIMEEAYMAASGGRRELPAKARQIFYQARPKIMALTEDKELAYGYYSQTLLPDYIEEHGVSWNVVYDARGHFEEPHTNRNIGCGTLEVDNYLRAMKRPEVVAAEFADAAVEIMGPAGGFSAILTIRTGEPNLCHRPVGRERQTGTKFSRPEFEERSLPALSFSNKSLARIRKTLAEPADSTLAGIERAFSRFIARSPGRRVMPLTRRSHRAAPNKVPIV